MEWPEFNEHGDLPPDIYQATLAEVLQHFATGTLRRRTVAHRLERIYKLAKSTGKVARFVVFGSFITAESEPKDVDVFMLMENSFDVSQVTGEAAIVLIIRRLKTLKAPVFFGFADSPQLAESMLHWNIGKSSETSHCAV